MGWKVRVLTLKTTQALHMCVQTESINQQESGLCLGLWDSGHPHENYPSKPRALSHVHHLRGCM